MLSPFRRITLDGTTRAGEELQQWLRSARQQAQGAAWTSDLLSTIEPLSTGSGDLPVHTSGTTGSPKAMVVSAHDLMASARLTEKAFGLTEGDRCLLCLPCEFIGGKMMVVRAMVSGLDLHCIDPRGGVLRNLRTRDRFRFTAMVPMQLHTALQHDGQRVAQQFDTILLGGGPVSGELVQRLSDLPVRVVLGYGSTETVTHVALRDLNGPDVADHFTAIGDVSFGYGSDDRLIVRTPHLSTKEHVTNDIVEPIDERRFRWLGRSDHVILSGGRKIHPERLEAMTAGVIGYPHFFAAAPDERLGQCVVLVVETGDPSGRVPAQVMGGADGLLLPHERPRRVLAVESFTRTASGKVERGPTLAQALMGATSAG